MFTFRNAWIAGAAVLIGACGTSQGEGTSEGEGTVSLQLASLDGAGLRGWRAGSVFPVLEDGLTAVVPEKFEMKILGAYVVEDIDADSNNVGQASMVWLNEGCGGTINGCAPSMVGYFDLTDPTVANTTLNSQALPIATGTYRYVRLEFCVGGADVENVRYTVGGTAFEKKYGGCGVTSAELEAPIELGAGDSITLQLSYDLTDGEIYSAEGSDTCTTEAPCLGGIELVPSIVQ